MKLPAFQFYPADWMKDPNLRRCTHAAKGVWIDILCLMSECEERGVLMTNGHVWDDEEIALAVGGDKQLVLSCIFELTLKGVSNRRPDGALICRRMVRDERKRILCKEAGKRGGNPNLVPTLKGASKGGLKGESNRKPTPSSSSSSSSSDSTIHSEGSETPSGAVSKNGEKAPKREKAPPSAKGMSFAAWFRKLLPDTVRLTDTWQTSWAHVYDDLLRIDKRDPKELGEVCRWARNNPFWADNFLSPAKLRDRKDGILFYDRLKTKMDNEKRKGADEKVDFTKGEW